MWKIACETMLYMIFPYCWKLVLTQRISIGFEAIPFLIGRNIRIYFKWKTPKSLRKQKPKKFFYKSLTIVNFCKWILAKKLIVFFHWVLFLDYDPAFSYRVLCEFKSRKISSIVLQFILISLALISGLVFGHIVDMLVIKKVRK